MNYLARLLGWGLSLCLLGGCSSQMASSSSITALAETPPPATEESSLGQILPIKATATIEGETIKLEVAETPQQQAMGLMYRTSLADDRGMLFSFNPPRPVRFWMKNCLISLDMIFLRDGVVRAIIPDVPPCTAEPCPTYGPDVAIDRVVELRGGRAAELGLEAGDRLSIQFIEGDAL
ncbi:MAG: DUF192 domain-containing protein [Cyanobacteriota bacterium]|nr:DUF192 domain-containing protein [Cyanobacteriota bacterium]